MKIFLKQKVKDGTWQLITVAPNDEDVLYTRNGESKRYPLREFMFTMEKWVPQEWWDEML